MKKLCLVTAILSLLAIGSIAQADLFSNGFETDIFGWDAPTRVASGTGGIASASGSYHAVTAAGAGDYTQWGGYNYGVGGGVATAFKEYSTSIDIYLNVTGGWANDTRFDFDSAISNASGNFLRDFIFNGGFYNDATGPGANTDRFVFSASFNSQPGSAYAKNPDRDPIAISKTGWYTFEHHFYDNAGVLAVDMSIYDSAASLVNSWTLSNPADLITGVGGNRYGWFDYNQFSTLAFDNTSLKIASASAVPEPATLLGFGIPMLMVGLGKLKSLRK